MYNDKIDILRGVSLFLVLLHHFNIPYSLKDSFLGFHLFNEPFIQLVARNGNYGVTLFFVISGFLITYHTMQRYGTLSAISLKAFYIRRIARIMPCLILLIIIVSLLGCLGLKPFLNQAPNGIEVPYIITIFAAFSFWMNILIIQNGWVNYALGVLWSLSVEEVFYLFFPVLCLLLRRQILFIGTLCGFIFYAPYFRSLYFMDDNEGYLYHYFSSFDAIAIGILTALIWQKCNVQLFQSVAVKVAVIILMISVYIMAPIKEVATWSVTVFAILSGLLILSFKGQTSMDMQHFSVFKLQHYWIWLGRHSYELYLFHLIILGLFKVWFFPAITSINTKLILLPAFLLLSIMLAALIKRFYADPLNGLIRKTFKFE
ncbi:MAG: acyltransferase [Acinetobacter sp.]